MNYFQRNLLDIEILSNLRFAPLEIRDTVVTRVTNNFEKNSLQVFVANEFYSSRVDCTPTLEELISALIQYSADD